MTSDEFLNPYTFVPAFPRDGDALPEPFRDGAPPCRSRLHPGRWTGRIGVTLTVETPLLVLDATRATTPSSGEPEHRVYPVQIRDGRPHLPATSVKGMLRAAYEAATNSRFGVFEGHAEPLSFRRDAGFALDMVPVLIGADGGVHAFEQAALEMYDKATGDSVYPRDGQEAPRHMESLTALIRTGSRNATKVVRIGRGPGADLAPGHGERRVRGIAYVTGPNIETKTSERFFYVEEGKGPRRLPLARPWEELVAGWNDLIRSYDVAHDPADLYGRRRSDGAVAAPGERIGAGPGRLAWSPHLYDPARRELKPGNTLCYARLVKGRVDRLYPVLVPRDLYPVAPADLLKGTSLEPAPSYDSLSPADRVFGWVAPQGTGVRPSAYRGRLRVGPVTCDQEAGEAVERFAGDGLPLAILSGPKPQQGRFYLSETRQRPDLPISDGTAREDLYRAGRGLRGRKAYWHHAGLDGDRHWSVARQDADPGQTLIGTRYREWRRPRSSPDDSAALTPDRSRYRTTEIEQRDTQNRSIGGWVRPGTRFRFTIEVRDLDDVELGALAWLLALPSGHFHRLGAGRPLGFGSVRLDVDMEGSELRTGREHADRYRSLRSPIHECDANAILSLAGAEFSRQVEASESLGAVRMAMLSVARGRPDLPVHYPRVRPDRLPADVPAPPDPCGGNYAWFTENERTEKGRSAAWRGRSLPGVLDLGSPLEVYPVKGQGSGKGAAGNGGNRNTGRKPSSGNGGRRRNGGSRYGDPGSRR